MKPLPTLRFLPRDRAAHRSIGILFSARTPDDPRAASSTPWLLPPSPPAQRPPLAPSPAPDADSSVARRRRGFRCRRAGGAGGRTGHRPASVTARHERRRIRPIVHPRASHARDGSRAVSRRSVSRRRTAPLPSPRRAAAPSGTRDGRPSSEFAPPRHPPSGQTGRCAPPPTPSRLARRSSRHPPSQARAGCPPKRTSSCHRRAAPPRCRRSVEPEGGPCAEPSSVISLDRARRGAVGKHRRGAAGRVAAGRSRAARRSVAAARPGDRRRGDRRFRPAVAAMAEPQRPDEAAGAARREADRCRRAVARIHGSSHRRGE